MRWLAAALVLAACGSDAKPGDDAGLAASEATAELPDITEAPEVEIERLGSKRFVVDREAVYGLLLDIAEGDAEIARTADGLVLSNIGLKSYAARLGLKNDDIVREGNGAPLGVRGGLRAALALARKDGEMTLAVTRAGENIELRYVFTDALGEDYKPRRYSRSSLDDDIYSFEKVLDALSKGVERVSDTELDVDRRVIRAIADNEGLLARTDTRRSYGKSRGFRITDEQSVYKELGITKYDVIKSVEDADVRSHYDMRTELAAAVDSNRFRISVLRLKEPMILTYNIVDKTGLDPDALATAIAAWKADYSPKSSYRDRYVLGSGTTGLGSPTRKPKDPLPGITKISDTEYEIERKTIDDLLANPAKFARGARIVPSMRNGVSAGFKLYAIRPSSIYAQLGLKNGDTIRAINGHQITSPDKALDVYTKVRSASSLRIELSRRGKDLELVYRVK